MMGLQIALKGLKVKQEKMFSEERFKCEMPDGENEKLYCYRVVCRKNRKLIIEKRREKKKRTEEKQDKP